MTTYNKQTLGTFFQNADVPQGQDFQNLIDSQVNIVETSVQNMGGALSVPELIASRVSAGNANFTGIVSAVTLYVDNLNSTNISFTNVSATNINAVSARITNANITTVSANTSYVTTAINPVTIISAAGTTQGAATLANAAICRVQGVSDGATTGILLMSARTGWEQVIHNETAVSANLWPTAGGKINGLSNDAAFAMAATTGYRVAHLTATTYSVK